MANRKNGSIRQHHDEGGHAHTNASSYDLHGVINNSLIFNNLPAGTYTYKVTATAVNGEQSTTQTLINQPFKVNYSTAYVTPILSISGETYPSYLMVGKFFGLYGTISTNCGSIISVTGSILSSGGGTVQSKTVSPNASSYDLHGVINDSLIFNYLSAGTYVYKVAATAVNGDKSVKQTLIEKVFTVG